SSVVIVSSGSMRRSLVICSVSSSRCSAWRTGMRSGCVGHQRRCWSGAVWVARQRAAMLNGRGWDAFRQRKARNAAALPSLVATHLLAQGFIRRRSRARWLAPQLVFCGCILAGLVTIPLTLGLLHFESVGQRADHYQVYLSRVGTAKFDAESIVGWFMFHALDVAAVLVLVGVFIFLRRRLRDPGAMEVERAG